MPVGREGGGLVWKAFDVSTSTGTVQWCCPVGFFSLFSLSEQQQSSLLLMGLKKGRVLLPLRKQLNHHPFGARLGASPNEREQLWRIKWAPAPPSLFQAAQASGLKKGLKKRATERGREQREYVPGHTYTGFMSGAQWEASAQLQQGKNPILYQRSR